jgi:transposase
VPIAAGIDVAKEVHWLVAINTANGGELLNHRLGNDPTEILAAVDELHALTGEHGPVTVGVDVMGGIAGLLTAVLTTAGLAVVHVPGLVVNRARRATVGGENKSDPRDARVIAEQVRHRPDLRPVEVPDELLVQLRLLVSRRTDLVTEQTRRIQRLREHLVAMFPALERAIDPTNSSDLVLLTRYVTPAEIRQAGLTGLREHLLDASVRTTRATAVAQAVLSAARSHHVQVAGQAVIAELVRELADEALAVKRRLREIDTRIRGLLDTHPDAALIASLPGMGAVLTAELLATTGGLARFASGNELAAAAGLAPVLQQSGRVRYLRRATTGKRALKRIFYRSAFCALSSSDPASKTYYTRKRNEGKSHHQAVIALARRRINVLHAIVRTRQPYNTNHRAAA